MDASEKKGEKKPAIATAALVRIFLRYWLH